MLKLDLACGDRKVAEDFVGVDIAKTPSVDIVHDLNQYPWPFEDNSVDEIHCAHYVEHIPHDIPGEDKRDGFIQFMDECYRILKPGATMTVIAPYYTSMRAFGDPTHRRYMADWSFFYFNKSWIEANKLTHYGIKSDFDMKYSYYVTNEMTLKSEEVRNDAFAHQWNVVDDIRAELKKR